MDPIEYCKTNYPETIETFKKLQEEDLLLFCKKQMDYGPSNISMGTALTTPEELNLSITALIIRMNDKIQRLVNLIIKHKREAANESIVDSFTDLSVYGIIARIVINNKWNK